MKLRVLVCLVALAGLVGCRIDGWKEYQPSDGSFSIRMPARPVKKDMSVDYSGGTLVLHTLGAAKGDFTCHLLYTDYPEGSLELREPDKLLADVGAKAVAKMGAQQLVGQIISIGKFRGREMNFETILPNANWRYRIYVVNSRLYQVIVQQSKNAPSTGDAERFFNSFRLLKE